MNRAVAAVLLGLVTAATVAALAWAASAWVGAAGVAAMLPWIVGRGLGIASYLSLFALTALGLWFRHPWRPRFERPAPEAILRVHAALAALTLLLVVGHVIALVVDPFAGVGLAGALLPGASHFRPLAVGLGSVAVYLGLLVGASAALAGRLGRIPWLPVHRLATASFAAIWLHALLAGSDALRLLPLYAATGLVIALLWVTRRLIRRPVAERVDEHSNDPVERRRGMPAQLAGQR